jgi:hypothetical protein
LWQSSGLEKGPDAAHIGPMEEYERHPNIVTATKDGKTEYWAVTYIREDAVDAVQQQLAPGWKAAITQRRLPIDFALSLKMGRRSVRKLPPGTEFLG